MTVVEMELRRSQFANIVLSSYPYAAVARSRIATNAAASCSAWAWRRHTWVYGSGRNWPRPGVDHRI